MKTFEITSPLCSESYTKEFETGTDARHFVINTLDLSMNWEIKEKQKRIVKNSTIRPTNNYIIHEILNKISLTGGNIEDIEHTLAELEDAKNVLDNAINDFVSILRSK